MKVILFLLVILFTSCASAQNQDLIKLDSDFKGEEKFNKTIYLSNEERKPYLIKVEKGLIMESKGKPLDTRLLPNGTAIFVYAQDGNIYISKQRARLRFDHSSLVAGEGVICAGSMKVERGQLGFITDSSAMYLTKDEKPLRATIKKLRLLGVDQTKMRVFFHFK